MGSGEMWSRSVLETRVAGPLISLVKKFFLSSSLAAGIFTLFLSDADLVLQVAAAEVAAAEEAAEEEAAEVPTYFRTFL